MSFLTATISFALVVVAAMLVACGQGASQNEGMATLEIGLDSQLVETFAINGAAQKGPFIKGSRIIINRLDNRGDNTYETGISYIQDDLGN